MSRVSWPCATCGALLLLVAGVAQAAPRWGRYHRAVCAAGAGQMHCMALEVTKSAGGSPLASSTPPAGSYGPSQLQTAYSLTIASAGHGAGETIAIVDAYKEPYLMNDLAVYRRQYGLPPVNSGSGPTFKIVNQSGGITLPKTDSGWGDEEALDVDMASAICPNCNIVLVEASSPTGSNLAPAEQTAQSYAGVVAVSNSWGFSTEFSSERSWDYLSGRHPTTVASGDSGTGASWPATSPNVTSVGGTTLNLTSGGARSSETVWSGGGSGCSAYEPQPAFQAFLQSSPYGGCAHRAAVDVSADADPNTGVAVYDSCGDFWSHFFMPAPCGGSYGWQQFGGTSVAAPIIASVFALAGNNNSSSGNAADQFLYQHDSSANFYDVTSGSNGSCSPNWVCHAGTGYDGPTGLGTPNGTGGF
jgi:subtilase family serine protease